MAQFRKAWAMARAIEQDMDEDMLMRTVVEDKYWLEIIVRSLYLQLHVQGWLKKARI